MTYDEALNFLSNKQSLGIKPGLIRVKEALTALGEPQNCYHVIHIAGTNGKGTVSATIAKALTDSGYTVGLFTSPWVTDYLEQIQLNGSTITQNDFTAVIQDVLPFCEDCTEFETLTVAAYRFFQSAAVDYAVIECGMGGLNDATNVEKTNLSVITSISLDHTDYLGNSVKEIAQQKAGILRKDGTCVLYNKELSKLFEDKCNKLITSPRKSNLKLVNLALELLGIPPAKRLVKLPARQEIIGEVMLDSGHNVSAAKKLAPHLENEIAVIGLLKDKDAEGYLKLIAPCCKTIIATSIGHERALPAEVIADIAEDYCDNVFIVENPKEAIRIQNLSLVCGSFYLAREVRKILFDLL